VDLSHASPWDIVGIVFAIVAGYFVVTRTVLPQFALPWLGSRKRQRAIDKVNRLLIESNLDDDDRHRMERCRNTLLAYDAAPRELWSGSLPISTVVQEIDDFWNACSPEESR
jgi:hypothetical protein